jgi:tricorn protease-like protein
VIATTIPGKVSVVSSKTTNQLAIIDNTLEAVRTAISLPAETESMAVTPDGRFAFAAVHNTNSIEVIDLSNGVLCTTLTTTCRGPITVNAPTKIVLSGDGKVLLVFSDNPTTADSVYVIDAVAATGTTGLGGAITPVAGFHKAVNAVFASDNVTAYVMNCGSECGGTAGTEGVQVLNTTAATNTGTNIGLGSAPIVNNNLWVFNTTANAPTTGGNGILCDFSRVA